MTSDEKSFGHQHTCGGGGDAGNVSRGPQSLGDQATYGDVSTDGASPAEQAEGRVYRLPTEAEWEYACRAGATTEYSFGDDDSLLGDFAWFDDNSGDRTHAVGQKRPNAWGLYVMHGNVWEWCSDWYGDYAPGTVRDPGGPASGSIRVLRGGGWRYSARYCRSARRHRDSPSLRISYCGFRLALSPS